MKQLFFSIIVLAILCLFVAFWGVPAKSNDSSDILLWNVQALANSEGSQVMDCFYGCETYDDDRPKETVTYCGDCQPVKCHNWYIKSACNK